MKDHKKPSNKPRMMGAMTTPAAQQAAKAIDLISQQITILTTNASYYFSNGGPLKAEMTLLSVICPAGSINYNYVQQAINCIANADSQVRNNSDDSNIRNAATNLQNAIGYCNQIR